MFGDVYNRCIPGMDCDADLSRSKAEPYLWFMIIIKCCHWPGTNQYTVSSGWNLLSQGRAVLGWSACMLREKALHVRLVATTAISWQGPLSNPHCCVAFTVCFLFKIFFLYYEWTFSGGSFPSYLVWMMSLIIIWTRYHDCSEQTRITEDVGAWHEQTQTHKQAFLSLL